MRLTLALILSLSLPAFAADKTDKQKADKKVERKAAKAAAAADPEVKNPPYVPGPLTDHRSDEALTGLDVAPGLSATLFAAEPMLLNPSAIDIDARGRVWVCEVVNYRTSLRKDHPQREAGDRILILEDTDGDGKADSAKVFYQGPDINSMHGICVLGNRILVTTPKQVLEFLDTDGDDKPDCKNVLFNSGGSDHDHALHTFNFGVDGKLYFNCGNDGKKIKTPDNHSVVDTAGRLVEDTGKPYREGMVFRMNPDGSQFQVMAWNFRNNWEVNIDSFGTLWQSDNDDDGNQGVRINYVMPGGNYGYKDEFTGAAWKTPRVNLESEIPKRHWHLNDPGVVPNLLQTGGGSPTGICIYEGKLLPEIFRGQIIHCDAGPNVVRSYPAQKDGAGYKASIAPILTGTRDKWFRPSDVVVAPDGSLIVADWYDPGVGGHRQGDLDRGRLFRIAIPRAAYKSPRLDLATPKGAVEALLSPNRSAMYSGWHALQGMKETAIPALVEVWRKSPDPRHRARALHVLTRIDSPDAYLKEAAAESDPDLRITAIRIARDLKGKDLIGFLKPLVKDSSPAVRREIALAMRDLDLPGIPGLWAALAQQHDGKDRWYLEALGIAARGHEDECFQAWMEHVRDDWNTAAGRDIVWRSRSKLAIPFLVKIIVSSETSAADRPRYFRAFDFHTDPSKDQALADLMKSTGPAQDQIVALALQLNAQADPAADPALKAVIDRVVRNLYGTAEYVDLVGRFKMTDQNESLLKLTLEKSTDTVGVEAVQVLARQGGGKLINQALADDAVAPKLINALAMTSGKNLLEQVKQIALDEKRSMPIRSVALRAYGRNSLPQQREILDWARAGRIPAQLMPVAAEVLFGSPRSEMREEAARYLQLPGAANAKPLPPIAELAKRTGDPEKGHAVFARTCVACHQINGLGIDFGPALSEIGSKLPKEDLYVSITNPSAAVSFGFEGWILKLKDGNELLGLIASETEDEVALKIMGGVIVKYPKSQIVSRAKQDQSLMTPGLYLSMTEQELVDLVEYLTTLKKK